MDGRTRELERAWVAGNPAAGSRYLIARQRAGETEFQIRVLLSGLFSSLGRNEFGLEEYLHNDSGIVMVAIPAGEFLMGAPDDQGHEEERPQHRVVFHRPFLIAKYAVTQGEWKRVMGLDNNPSHFQGLNGRGERLGSGDLMDEWGHLYDRHPVEQVSWDDAQEFCRRTMLRLPTEAMWEYACRAGTTTRYHSGDDERDLERVAWCGRDFNEGHRAVGLKEHNQFGLGDMHGNTFEWCQDPWNRNYEGAPENGFIAWGDDTGYNHALWIQGELEELTLLHVGAKPPAEVLEEHSEEEGEPRRSAYGLSLKLAPDPSAPPRGHGPGPGSTDSTQDPGPVATAVGLTPTNENPSAGSDPSGSPDPTQPAGPAASTGVVAGNSSQGSASPPGAPSTGPAIRASTWDSDQSGSSDPTRSSSAPQLGPGPSPTTSAPAGAAGLTPTDTVAEPNSDSESPGSSDPTEWSGLPAPRAGAIQSAGPTAPLDTLAAGFNASTPASVPLGSPDPTQSVSSGLRDGTTQTTGTIASPDTSAPQGPTSSPASAPSGRSSFPVQRMHVGESAGQDTREVQVDPDPTPGDGPRASVASSPPINLHHHPQPSRRPSSGSRPSETSASTGTNGRSSSASDATSEPTSSGSSGVGSTARCIWTGSPAWWSATIWPATERRSAPVTASGFGWAGMSNIGAAWRPGSALPTSTSIPAP